MSHVSMFIFISSFLFLCSLYFFSKNTGRNIVNITNVIFVFIFTMIFGLLTGSYLIVDWFTGVGFDDSVFYHLTFGVEGAGFFEFIPQMLLFSFVLLLFVTAAVLYSRKTTRATEHYRIKNVLMGTLMVVFAFFCNPATSNLMSYLYRAQSSEDFATYFIKPQVDSVVVRPKNILYFYLESMERNYMNEKLFPGLLPELHKIENEGMSFTDIGQTIGGSWTMAGMVSSQCGLPLLSVFTNNNFYMNNFMPNAVCLGDILKSKGYHLEYMGGADSKFAGKGLFYKSHGFETVKGKNEFFQDGVSRQYANDWGLFDDSLYESLMQRIKKLHDTKKPWGVFSINIGTHQPEGFLARSCEKVKYGDGKDKLLNAVHCTDKLIGGIYRQLKQEGILDDTLVIFGSDHLAPSMVKPFETLSKTERHNLLIFSGAGIKPGTSSRVGTTLDVAPTVLGYLQYGSHPVGLGRDLNGSESTLKETFKYKTRLDSKLLSWRSVIDMAFWGYPELKGAVQIESSEKNIVINGKKLKYPSLISYNRDGNIKDIVYRSYELAGDNRYLPAFYLMKMTNDQLFLWVDKCKEMSTLSTALNKSENEYCYYNGSLLSELSSGTVPAKGITIDTTHLPRITKTPSETSVIRHQLEDKNLVKWDNYQWKYPGKYVFPLFLIQAAAHNSLSGATGSSGWRPDKEGLYFVRFSYHYDNSHGNRYQTDVISDLSLCNEADKETKLIVNAKEPPLNKSYTTLFYALIGDVTQQCSPMVNHVAKKYHLNSLNNLALGSSYIALLDKQKKVVYEKTGKNDETIAISVSFETTK